jgi:peptide-methionine (S)-S-oxide reductase
MKVFLFFLFCLSISDNMNAQNNAIKTATIGSGCFWCSEAIFERVNGVIDVTPGYSGGHVKNPSYREVCNGTTGHAEVIQITYDPSIISFAELLEIFFKTHDPTQLNRQGADIGEQYRSVIFYHDEDQKKTAGKIKAELNKEKVWDKPIVTAIEPFPVFYKAEDYHNDYYNNNPTQGYCQFVITPKIEKFEKVFSGYLKAKK